ncbi:hypothetical protein HF086_005689 [Spodoptera exigua]|uniref:Odorant receptor n=1 Tax=Spodoptera exigua TaxID=7107 RepID=A0A922MYE2_SPOEX|nr:hypothetical protein HF086_005689 [Spodoptera exigua]
MLYAELPIDYENTFGRYIFLFRCIGLDFFEDLTITFNKNNVKLALFSLTFYPFMASQFALITKISGDNFLENIHVVPVDLMFFQVFFIFAITNLALFEVIPFLISVFNLCNGNEVYLFPFQPPNFWDVDSFCTYILIYLWELAGNQLSSVFGLVIFIHVAFAALEICFFGFLTLVYGGVADTIANLLTVFNAVFTIFLLSLSGQFLCDTSSTSQLFVSSWIFSVDSQVFFKAHGIHCLLPARHCRLD